MFYVKEESEKIGLKLNIKKTKIMASSSITSWQIEGGIVKVVTYFIFLGAKIIAKSGCRHKIKRHLLLGRKAMTNLVQFSSVQSLNHVWLFVTPWTAACQDSLSITNCQSLLKPKSIELVMPSNHLIVCRPLLLLPTIFPSIRVFSNESVVRIRWPKDWSFSYSISPSNKYSGLIFFRIDWFDLLADQGASQKFSPALEFKSINSLALSLLYGPSLPSVHDYWKSHSLYQQNDISAV